MFLYFVYIFNPLFFKKKKWGFGYKGTTAFKKRIFKFQRSPIKETKAPYRYKDKHK
jgi:hypothetical protein